MNGTCEMCKGYKAIYVDNICASCAGVRECGHVSNYPETKGGRLVCSSCAMAYDYAESIKTKNYALFN